MALPSVATRHMISRFGYGFTPQLQQTVEKSGGPQSWFERQLSPSRIKDSGTDALATWFPYLTSSPPTKVRADTVGKRPGWQQQADLVRWTILRRMTSNRQVLENMVDFWSNLLHVPADSDGWAFRRSYDVLIRRYALGTFSDLLVQTAQHPAMGIYLNSVESTKTPSTRTTVGSCWSCTRWASGPATPRTW